MIDRVPMTQRMAPLKQLDQGKILVHEIYASIQGESAYRGMPCTFIRTTGCHLRCNWCDTPHAFYEGTPWRVEDIIQKVDGLGITLVEVTGGEPLLQKAVPWLLTRLCDAGFDVLLETSGGTNISIVDHRVYTVLDVKCPGSGEATNNLWRNLTTMERGEVKFVVCDRADFDWAWSVVAREHLKYDRVCFSPVTPGLDPGLLAQWIIESRLPVRMQVQLHKVLWGDKHGV